VEHHNEGIKHIFFNVFHAFSPIIYDSYKLIFAFP
jgi:hypothetical protein